MIKKRFSKVLMEPEKKEPEVRIIKTSSASSAASFWTFLSMLVIVIIVGGGVVYRSSLDERVRSFCTEKNTCEEHCNILIKEIKRKQMNLDEEISKLPHYLEQTHSKLCRVSREQVLTTEIPTYLGKMSADGKQLTHNP